MAHGKWLGFFVVFGWLVGCFSGFFQPERKTAEGEVGNETLHVRKISLLSLTFTPEKIFDIKGRTYGRMAQATKGNRLPVRSECKLNVDTGVFLVYLKVQN